ncbi:hypothetical protein OA508_00165 [Candidatus Pelagibacter sp.]|nr:hypothetical protein [Candidatus Pelagibacter sp.]
MATINLGNIKFQWQGTYNAGTTYAVDDVVAYNGSSYVCILASTGNLPTNTTYWNVMSQAGTDGTDVGTTLTTQGDILYRDASGLARLGYGTAGYVLQTGGSGANPSWTAVSSDFVRIANLNLTSGTKASFDNVFSSSDGYQSYKTIIHGYRPNGSGEWLKFRWRNGGSDLTNNYRWRVDGFRRTSSNSNQVDVYGNNADSYIPATYWSQRTDGLCHVELNLGDPTSSFNGHGIFGSSFIYESNNGILRHATAGVRENTATYDGFSIEISNTSYTFSNMNISVYGIK